MKILCVSDHDPINAWVAVKLAERFNSSHIVRIDWQSQRTKRQRLIRALKKPKRTLASLYISPRLRLWERTRESKFREFMRCLAIKPDVLDTFSVIEVPGSEFNKPSNIKRLRDLQPDLMIVCGGPILKEEVFNIPRLGTWNIHFGIAPFYRGNHTVLWPLMVGDFDYLGATIHQIDKGVDTGKVFARIYPEIEPGDTEFSIEMKIARLAQSTMAELVDFVQDKPSITAPSGIKFHEPGLQIFTHDLMPWVEIKHFLRRFFRPSSLPSLPERRELFYKLEGGR